MCLVEASSERASRLEIRRGRILHSSRAKTGRHGPTGLPKPSQVGLPLNTLQSTAEEPLKSAYTDLLFRPNQRRHQTSPIDCGVDTSSGPFEESISLQLIMPPIGGTARALCNVMHSCSTRLYL